MKKLIIILSIFLVGVATAASVAVYEGGWQDGAKIRWLCKPGTDGAVKIQFTTPEGKDYYGELSCGVGV